jgi:hypothetical protein
LGGVVLFGVTPLALAQDATEELGSLTRELEQLQQDNQALQEELDQQQALTQQLLRQIETLEGRDVTLTEEVRRITERPMAAPAEEGEIAGLPKMTIKVFGDAGYTTMFKGATHDNAFWIGRQDFFFIGRLTDRLSALVEADLHFHALEPRTNHFHLERALVKYALSDAVNVTVGEQHTPLGYWGHTFHHGAWLFTPVFVPDVFEFERGEMLGDPKGGTLPIHNVGVDVGGVLEVPMGDLGYNMGVFNGRPDDLDDISAVSDQNDFKAVNTHLMFMPHHWMEGLQLGANFYVDKIAPERSGTATLQFRDGIREVIVGSYATYYRGGLELLGELFWIFHDDPQRDQSYETMAGYHQIGYRISERYTPYYRLDYIDYANSDPVWDGYSDLTKHTFGLRWDVSDWNAIKLQYTLAGFKGLGDADEQLVVLNSSWTF